MVINVCSYDCNTIETLLDPINEFPELLREYMGQDAENAFNLIIEDVSAEADPRGDDYERIADGYWNMLADIRNALEEILSAKRISRKQLEALYNEINDNI